MIQGSGCNSNQNSYVLASGGRSTSRVLAPPGGYSSFSLGMSSAAPLQPISTNRKNAAPINNSYSNNLPPKHPSKGGPIGGYREGRQGMDQGDALDRMMKKSNPIPGLENHYSKLDRKYGENSSEGTSSLRPSQRPLGRNEYAEELRKQIEQKKEIDSQMERNQRRSYSFDAPTNNTSNPSNEMIPRGRHGGPRGALSQEEYAASLKSQITQKNSMSLSDSYNPRTQVKAYSAPEPTRSGRGSVPPGGHSSFSMRWDT